MDRRIADFGATHHLVFGLGELAALGLSAGATRRRAAAGRLHRVHSGVYSLVPPALLPREGRWRAAVLACGPGAVLSHRSAAGLHELRAYGPARTEITVPHSSPRVHAGILAHRCALDDEDITLLRGIPCTTVARTLVDLAAVVPLRVVERVCDQAEIAETFDLWAIQDQFERHPRRPGTRRLRSVLETHYIGTTPTWTDIEERFLALVRAAGLPAPTVNDWVDPGDGEPAIRVDFVWRAQRIALETDGRRTHMTAQAFERDRRRDQRLTAARWRPLRATWRQILNAPRALELTLQRVFRAPA